MKCYKPSSGCGVYEMRSCNECPYSKPRELSKPENLSSTYADVKFSNMHNIKLDNSRLADANKKMRDECYKDDEVKHLKNEIEELESRLSNAFYITTEENQKIGEWKSKHIKEKHDGHTYAGAIGGRFSYEFVPTSIGVIGSIKCSCGEEFVFSNI